VTCQLMMVHHKRFISFIYIYIYIYIYITCVQVVTILWSICTYNPLTVMFARPIGYMVQRRCPSEVQWLVTSCYPTEFDIG